MCPPMQAVNPEMWVQVKTVAADALELPLEKREAFIRAKCSRSEAILEAALELLGFADSPQPADAGVPRFGRFAGRRVGPYQIHWALGTGGLGEVYLATRIDSVRMRVAIKFLRPDCTHPGLVRRFHAEAQILAALDHPNIVRLVDAGETDGGQPWFAMEYVEGTPIDTWCREQRLSLDQRLTLVREMCNTLQHAHNHLLVHRDIKPGNIFVTRDGVLKLLDFGIAKLLRPEFLPTIDGDIPTAVWERPLTPDYASPEQLTGSPITTAADIYSLGIVMYQLLTGTVPFRSSDQQSWQDFVRSVTQQQIPRPSAMVTREAAATFGEAHPDAIAHRVKGELDNVVLKAVDKAPLRRYATASEMGEDIQRYQGGLPVRAHPDTVRYRMAKFSRRHVAAIAAAVAILLSLAGGLWATLLQKGAADRNLSQVRDLAEEMGQTFSQVQNTCLAVIPAAATTARLESSDKLEDQLAASYVTLVDALRADGQNRQAAEEAKALIDIRARIMKEHPSDPVASKAYADAQLRYGSLASGTLGFAASNLAGPADLKRPGPSGADVALAMYRLGEIQRLSGDRDSALRSWKESESIYENLVAAKPADKELRRKLDQLRLSMAKL
jgi:eukaryotic-like serine/threonine-protein kinase